MEERAFSVDVLGKAVPVEYIKSAEKALSALSEMAEFDGILGLDIETTPLHQYREYPEAGLSPHLSHIRTIQIFDTKRCIVLDMFYVPMELVRPFINNKRFVAHNAIFEMANLVHKGCGPLNLACTYLIAKLLFHATYPTDAGLAASLEALVKTFLGVSLPKPLQLSDFGGDLTYEQVEYAANDAIYVKLLSDVLARGIQNLNLWDSYQLLKDVQYPTACMHLNGLKLDVEYHRKLIEIWKEELYSARKHVLEITGLDDLTNAKLGGWLEKNLPSDVLRVWPRTNEDTDRLSTSAQTFKEFDFLEVVKPFAQFQKREKLCSTYGNSLLSRINPVSGHLHTQYNIAGARTGRWSSSKPNLQNLPNDELVRAAFVAPEGYVYMCADYSQIEVRIMAELSRDENLLKAFREGLDVYKFTAAEFYRVPYDQVTPAQRKSMKPVVLGRLYGLGAETYVSYARNYGETVTFHQGREFIEHFKEMYFGVTAWQREAANKAKESEMVQTPWGKKRKLASDKTYGAGLNTPIQGGAAEIIDRALIRIQPSFIYQGPWKLVHQVHDELGAFIPNTPQDIEHAEHVLRSEMISGFQDMFPEGIINNLVDIKYGNNWAEAK